MSTPFGLLVQLQAPEGSWVDVGILYNLDARNWFEFSDSYWNLASRPVLGQIFEEAGPAWQPSAHVALPHWFSHLLPEGRLRDAVAEAAQINRVREFNLIARIGFDDLPGAIRFKETEGVANVRTPPELEEAESQERESNPLRKFSLSGAQLKFSIYRTARGLTVPVKGQAGNAIAKLPDGRPGFSGVPEAELACLNLAARAGIEVPVHGLAQLSSIVGLEEWAEKISEPALIVHRFDRRADDRRVHMEELAQILNIPTARENAKYERANFETIATFIGALCGVDSVGHVIDRIIFNILVGNGDPHLKNWAVLYPDGVTPELSPMYDVLPTVLYMPSDDMGLNLSGSKIFENVHPGSFDLLAQRTDFGVQQARKRVSDAVERTLAYWSELGEVLSLENFERLNKRLSNLQVIKRKE
jgi:serine/threonine-protein kinase HipA